MGDIDGDLKTDVAYFAQTGGELYVYGFGAAGTWVHKGTGNVANSTGAYPYVTMGDYDGDSIAVQFQASELLFANPHPVVVIASDPYWADIQTGGSTSFGTTSTTAESRDKNVGFSVGVTFGYEAEGIFDIYKASLKTSFESSFDWTATQSVEIDESYSYSTSDEDLVIFTVVPYDVYYYKVIQAPDPKMVGTTITVNLPRTPITLPVERGFYNDHNGSAPDIDSSVLTHTIGNPLSYPNQEQAKSLIAYNGGEGLMSSNMLSVGEGSGNTSIEMANHNKPVPASVSISPLRLKLKLALAASPWAPAQGSTTAKAIQSAPEMVPCLVAKSSTSPKRTSPPTNHSIGAYSRTAAS